MPDLVRVERKGVEAPAPGAADNVGDGQLRTAPADQIGDQVGTTVGRSSRTHHVKAPPLPEGRLVAPAAELAFRRSMIIRAHKREDAHTSSSVCTISPMGGIGPTTFSVPLRPYPLACSASVP